jgi:uncharacterized membrane protein HdeD (DUF308 family)
MSGRVRGAHHGAMSDFPADFETPIPPPPRPVEYEGLDSGGWWLSILVGLGLVVVGVWLLSNLYESVFVLAMLVGISLIVGGLAEIVLRGGRDDLGWVSWVAGGLMVVAGLVVLAWPDITLKTLAVLAGLVLVLVGVVRITMALESHSVNPDWPLQLGLGAVGVVLGGVVLAWPGATLMVLGFFLGVRAVITGLIAVGTGWKLHQLAR